MVYVSAGATPEVGKASPPPFGNVRTVRGAPATVSVEKALVPRFCAGGAEPTDDARLPWKR